MDIKQYIEENWESIEQDIAHMISIPSIEEMDKASETEPFGPQPRVALDEILKIADRMGMDVQPCDNYCGVVDVAGKDDQEFAIVAHVDVVPAGPGWSTEPYSLVKRDGYYLGRGVEDDKGPAIIALWAVKYFIDNNIKLNHKVRFIFGSNEESGMGAVKKYVAENPQPDFMMTPDAEFPIICGEKGIVHGQVDFKFPSDSLIKDIEGGAAKNAVPGEAFAIVETDFSSLNDAEGLEISDLGDGTVKILAHGVSGHASMPEGTVNAIRLLIDYLTDNNLVLECDNAWIEFANKLLADSYGEGLGIACEEDFLGKLTCVGSMIGIEDGVCTITIDIRYPGAITKEEIFEAMDKNIASFEGKFTAGHTENSHLVDPDDPKVQALLKGYIDTTGKDATPIAIGGGTYAKRFDRSVAFGPCELEVVKPEWAGSMHGPNEAVAIDDLKNAMEVYIRAIENVMELDLRA